MSKLTLNPDYQLYERNGQSFCDSLQVAETFGKQHKHILDSIRNEIEGISNFAADFSAANFVRTTYKERGKQYPMYLMTKDGFTFLVMGFTGKKAAKFKIAYINRFNAMESFIKSLLTAKMEYPALTEAVMNAHDEPKHYHFSNEINMINRIVLGCTAKEFKQQRGLALETPSIRPYLSDLEIKGVETLQRIDVGLLAANHQYTERKQILNGHYRNHLLRLPA